MLHGVAKVRAHNNYNLMRRSIALSSVIFVGSIAASAKAAVVTWNVNAVIGSAGSEYNYFDVFNQVHDTTDQSGPGVSYNFNSWCSPFTGVVGFEGYLGASHYAFFAINNISLLFNAPNGSSIDHSLWSSDFEGGAFSVVDNAASAGFTLNSTNNFVAFRISDGDGQFNYGWLQLELFSSVSDPNTRIIGMAYESDLGAAITVPSAPTPPIPAPAVPVLLAAVGLIGSRRRQI